jgi:8-oxo-dGTP pyrophosphatase MutT (NUDIX family)
MTEHQFGAGGVVMKWDGEHAKVLLIKDSYGHWTWPKGHIENNETPAETALREISEETGLAKLEAVEELGMQEYYFTLHGKKIFKTVHIFLVKAEAGEKINVQKSEIQDGEWVSPQEALAKIEYKGSRELLSKGIEKFTELCG